MTAREGETPHCRTSTLRTHSSQAHRKQHTHTTTGTVDISTRERRDPYKTCNWQRTFACAPCANHSQAARPSGIPTRSGRAPSHTYLATDISSRKQHARAKSYMKSWWLLYLLTLTRERDSHAAIGPRPTRVRTGRSWLLIERASAAFARQPPGT